MIKLLDHGYVKYVRHMGDDTDVIEDARMSTDKGFQGWDTPCDQCNGSGAAIAAHFIEGGYPCKKCGGRGTYGDERLLKRLWTHKHTTPFEGCALKVEVQAPIFVFREWHRHRTQSYNEMSGRYVQLPKLVYIPSVERMIAGGQSKTNKQGAGEELDIRLVELARSDMQHNYEEAWIRYETMLRNGVARELASRVLPVGQYSRMRATANLLNWLKFLELRMAPEAQWEIREYAFAVASIIKALWPRTFELFNAGRYEVTKHHVTQVTV